MSQVSWSIWQGHFCTPASDWGHGRGRGFGPGSPGVTHSVWTAARIWPTRKVEPHFGFEPAWAHHDCQACRWQLWPGLCQEWGVRTG